MFGLPTSNRIGGHRRVNAFAAEANRPVHLTGAAVAIFNRIADSNDPLGKRKPIPWPVGEVPVRSAEATCG